jgi:hypothetical protein
VGVRVLLFSVVTNTLVLSPIVYMLEVYDRVINSRNHQTLVMLTILLVGLYVALEALEWVRRYHPARGCSRLHLVPTFFTTPAHPSVIRFSNSTFPYPPRDWAVLGLAWSRTGLSLVLASHPSTCLIAWIASSASLALTSPPKLLRFLPLIDSFLFGAGFQRKTLLKNGAGLSVCTSVTEL